MFNGIKSATRQIVGDNNRGTADDSTASPASAQADADILMSAAHSPALHAAAPPSETKILSASDRAALITQVKSMEASLAARANERASKQAVIVSLQADVVALRTAHQAKRAHWATRLLTPVLSMMRSTRAHVAHLAPSAEQEQIAPGVFLPRLPPPPVDFDAVLQHQKESLEREHAKIDGLEAEIASLRGEKQRLEKELVTVA